MNPSPTLPLSGKIYRILILMKQYQGCSARGLKGLSPLVNPASSQFQLLFFAAFCTRALPPLVILIALHPVVILRKIYNTTNSSAGYFFIKFSNSTLDKSNRNNGRLLGTSLGKLLLTKKIVFQPLCGDTLVCREVLSGVP